MCQNYMDKKNMCQNLYNTLNMIWHRKNTNTIRIYELLVLNLWLSYLVLVLVKPSNRCVGKKKVMGSNVRFSSCITSRTYCSIWTSARWSHTCGIPKFSNNQWFIYGNPIFNPISKCFKTNFSIVLEILPEKRKQINERSVTINHTYYKLQRAWDIYSSR